MQTIIQSAQPVRRNLVETAASTADLCGSGYQIIVLKWCKVHQTIGKCWEKQYVNTVREK